MKSDAIIIQNKQIKRNDYIDFLRGIAAIGIVAIHTAFWGGVSYTPEWFRNITLFLDVPFFFYLSGWASSYRKSDIAKTCKSLFNIWLKWVFFISVFSVFCYITQYLPHTFQGVADVRDLINNYMFNVSFPGFPVVAGSIWFMPYYFVVMIANTIIVMTLEKNENEEELKRIYMWLLLASFVWVIYGKYYFGIDVRYFLFYSFFWMLGLNRMGKCEKKRTLILALIVCVLGYIFFSYIQGLRIYDIQSSKFPPALKYGFASMMIILITKYFDGYRERYNRFVLHIGKNAIWYYFGQGIGSSLNYYAIEAIKINNWAVKWTIVFAINVVITIFIAEILAFTYIKLCTGINLLMVRAEKIEINR